MRVVEAFNNNYLMLIVVTWNNTSSNGWEYFIVWKDSGSSPRYKCYLCVLWVILILICRIMFSDNIIIEFEELTQTWFGWIGYALILEFQGCVFKSYLKRN